MAFERSDRTPKFKSKAAVISSNFSNSKVVIKLETKIPLLFIAINVPKTLEQNRTIGKNY